MSYRSASSRRRSARADARAAIATGLLLVLVAVPAAAADRSGAPCAPRVTDTPRVASELDLTRSSDWTAGDYDRERWCAQVFLQLRRENPATELREVRSWEESRSACEPFYCPQYRYHCTVHVRVPAMPVLRASAACR